MRSNKTSTLCLLVFLFVVVPNASAQGFFSTDLTIHQTQTTTGGRGGGKSAVTNYMSGNAVKTSNSDGTDFVLRLDQQKMYMVDNNKKTYTEITFQQLEQMANQASALTQDKEAAEAMKKMGGFMGGGTTEVTVESLGPGEVIAGYPTQKYLINGPMQMRVWAAPDLKVPAQYYEAIKSRMPRMPMMDFGKIYDEMKKINGMPVKQITTIKMMGMEMTTTTVVDSVEKGAIAKTVFDIPAGYRKIDFNPEK
jgi:hypothetical protein